LAPTDVPPTAIPTDVPTLAPTDVLPTAIPTDVPTQDTTVPPTAAPTVEVMPSPTLASEPPVFNFANGTVFEATAGTPTVIQASITDSLGLVSVVSTGVPVGTINFTTAAPSETAAPFNTLMTLNYTPLLGFSGTDSITLIAINLAGVQSRITLTINVAAVTATPTPTLTPTPLAEPMRELIISYDANASEAAIQSMLASLGAIEEGRIPQIGTMRVLVPESKSDPSKAMATVQSAGTARLAGVTHAEQNFIYHVSYTPNDLRYPQQWGLSDQSGLSPVGGIYASYAWDISTARGLGINVAVVDSGVDLQHPDLMNQLVPGWDFVNDDNNPDDDLGHGTHVAGIIAAQGNNTIGMAGVAFNAKIMPIKSCDKFGACPLYYVAEGIIYATDAGARVINLSLSSTTDASTMQGAINYALSRNVVVVAAAGNDGCSTCENPPGTPPVNPVEYPAFYPGVISVGAHDSFGNIWEDDANSVGSTHNSNVLVSAPGVDVPSLWPKELDLPANTHNPADLTQDGYTTETGTSMAAAFTSGVVALLESANIATTPATVRDALMCGAEDDIPNSGRDDFYGYGRLKADLSMNWNYNSTSCKATLPNDNFQSATVISALPYGISQAVSDRSVTEQPGTDPQICGALREQTLWYKYQPAAAGYYQFTTFGSSYIPVVGVFRGTAGALTSIGCVSNASSTPQQFVLPLDALQTYYIAVATDTGVVDNQILQLRVNPAIAGNNLDFQDTAAPFAYVGMWAQAANTLASGGTVKQTNADNALVAFSFRGTYFNYARTVGPDRGSVQIYVNGSLIPEGSISNQGAVTKYNQVYTVNVPSPIVGNWNTVYIKRDPSAIGLVDIDRIRTFDFDANTLAGVINAALTNELADDRDVRLRYSGSGWQSLPSNPSSAYLSTLKETDVLNDAVTFRFYGNALTITRMTGPGFADMQVTIDNGLPLTVSNLGDNSTSITRGYMIDNLPVMQHVVEILRLGATDPMHTIQLDAVQGLVKAAMAVGTVYDERAINVAYRGVWTNNAVTGAYASTTRSFTSGSEASFKFAGNDLCIGYQRVLSSPFTANVYVDGTLLLEPLKTETINDDGSGSAFAAWCMEFKMHTLLADTLHYVQLVPLTGTFKLDYITPKRYVTLTPARGMVQETDASFRYSAPTAWTLLTTTAISVGGFAPRGGSLKRTSTDGTTITFYINGTGFILYTSVGASTGCWNMSVDDVAPTLSTSIDLTSPPVAIRRYRPLGYGISGLTPGIHRIQLIADTDCQGVPNPPGAGGHYPVDFDAVRVFP
jgi:thermitase